jgi:hypothetical protein
MQYVTGISGYMLSFVVDSQGGSGIINPPPFNFTPSTQEEQTIFIAKNSLRDGDTIIIWLNASDIAGNQDFTKLKIGVDRTAPDIIGDSFKAGTADEATSRYVWLRRLRGT